MKDGLKFFLILFAVCGSGCAFFEAPSVSNEKPGGGSVSVDQAIGGGCTSGLGGEVATVTHVPLRKRHDNDKWVFWTAGSENIVEEPAEEWIQSAQWDLRIKRTIPIVSANGGETSLNIARLDPPLGRAAFLLWEVDHRRNLPTVADLQARTDWSEDRYEGIELASKDIEMEPISLIPDYQNPLVNRISAEGNLAETGLVVDYDPDSHDTTLSGNVFVLRTADGNRFFAVRFCEYSFAEKWIKFQWVPLK